MAHIKGHPNCQPGECFTTDCHVVACAIYQGYEEPEIEEDDIPEVKKEENSSDPA